MMFKLFLLNLEIIPYNFQRNLGMEFNKIGNKKKRLWLRKYVTDFEKKKKPRKF